jgi:hypothetical protein
MIKHPITRQPCVPQRAAGIRPLHRRMAPLAVLAAALLSAAWVRPQVPTTAKPAEDRSQKLDYMIIAVNGEPRMVRDGQEITIVRGDKLLVKDASLVDRSMQAGELNVVGFVGSRKTPANDKGFELDTAVDLKPGWSEDGRGDVYAIVAATRSLRHGSVFVRLLEPELRYAQLSVNGKPMILRAGEPITVAGPDKVKVERVVTNLQSNAGVYFQIVPAFVEPDAAAADLAAGAAAVAAAPAEPKPVQDYEIRFLRGERLFATIPLKVKVK